MNIEIFMLRYSSQLFDQIFTPDPRPQYEIGPVWNPVPYYGGVWFLKI